MGVNVIILEVNYGFEYQSHPELRADNALSRNDARELTALCRAHGITLIPMFNCLGHQSWAKTTFPLLKTYPEFDETPDIPLDNPGIYCRSWCPRHPGVNKVVFALMDELIEAFDAPAFHVGMDEVFLIAEDSCPRCAGQDAARIFAEAVNAFHDHLVERRGIVMLMWGDRLLDGEATGYGMWEASKDQPDKSKNPWSKNTSRAIDLIPRDIIICDWHYEKRDAYPSVEIFQQKGFRIWPSSWRNPDAALAFLRYARKHDTGGVIGHLCTTWYTNETPRELAGVPYESENTEHVKNVVTALRLCMEEMQKTRSEDTAAP
ncbi:MAG: family 20 glycosylhydrolase [Candidatus Sumerlaeia bacterium]